MTPNQRDKYIRSRVQYWRKKLEVPDSLSISIKYMGNNDSQNVLYAEVETGMLEYGKAVIKIYDEVFQAEDFKSVADSTICHEMLHIFLHPLTAYCANMFGPDDGKRAELERLEEHIVNGLERIFCGPQ